MPLNDIILKIKEKSGLSEQEINSKINDKLEKLSGLISKEGAAHIIANELGIKLFEQTEGKISIKNILAGMRNVETVGRIARIFEVREFVSNDKKGKVGSFIIGEGADRIRVVCWHNKADTIAQLKDNMLVKIKGGYVKENNGVKEVHIGERSDVVLNPEGETVKELDLGQPIQSSVRKMIKELGENDNNIEILAHIVQIYNPNFFEVCPQCNKRIREREGGFKCEEHGVVTPTYSYVMNVFLDDGSDNIRAVFFRNQMENLLKKKQEEMLLYRENPDKFEDVKTELLGKLIKVVGRVTKNTMFDRLEFVSQMVYPDPDATEELKKLELMKATLEKTSSESTQAAPSAAAPQPATPSAPKPASPAAPQPDDAAAPQPTTPSPAPESPKPESQDNSYVEDTI